MGLAHLPQDAKYAIQCSDTAFSTPFPGPLPGTIAIGQRRETLKDTTVQPCLHNPDRRLDAIITAIPTGDPDARYASAWSPIVHRGLDTILVVLAVKLPMEPIAGVM